MVKFDGRHAGPALLLVFALVALAEARQPGADAARRIVADLETSWNAGDGAGWARHYWPDGELVNIFGGVIEGRDRIAQRVAAILAGAFSGSKVTLTIRRIRQFGPDVLVVDVDQDNAGTAAEGDAARQPVRTRMKHVLERRDGVWGIAASQNTRVVQPDF